MDLRFCDFRCSFVLFSSKQTNISSEEEQEAAGGFLQEKDQCPGSNVVIAVTNILKSTFLVMIDGSQQTRTWNQMIFLVYSDYFQVQTFRRTILSSKQACYFPATNF